MTDASRSRRIVPMAAAAAFGEVPVLVAVGVTRPRRSPESRRPTPGRATALPGVSPGPVTPPSASGPDRHAV